jgi:hypothetical protein
MPPKLSKFLFLPAHDLIMLEREVESTDLSITFLALSKTISAIHCIFDVQILRLIVD